MKISGINGFSAKNGISKISFSGINYSKMLKNEEHLMEDTPVFVRPKVVSHESLMQKEKILLLGLKKTDLLSKRNEERLNHILEQEQEMINFLIKRKNKGLLSDEEEAKLERMIKQKYCEYDFLNSGGC